MLYTLRFFLFKMQFVFIIITHLVPVLFTFYIEDVLKLKKNNFATKRLTLSSLLVQHIISSIRINRMTTRSRWKFRIYTITDDLALYSFSSLYTFVNRGWPTVAETCRKPNKTDTKTVVFWRTYPLLICIKHDGDDASKDL